MDRYCLVHVLKGVSGDVDELHRAGMDDGRSIFPA